MTVECLNLFNMSPAIDQSNDIVLCAGLSGGRDTSGTSLQPWTQDIS